MAYDLTIQAGSTFQQIFRVAKLFCIAGVAALAWSFWSFSRRIDKPA